MRGNVLAIAVQLSGLVLAPLLPGVIQTIKARLQGRVGTSPLQPYRDLRRLWGKRSVAPHDSTYVYRLAPSLSAAALASAVLVAPPGAVQGVHKPERAGEEDAFAARQSVLAAL